MREARARDEDVREEEALLERFGEGIRVFLTRAGKARHASSVYDLRRRTLMGSYAYFDHLPWALEAWSARTTPEAIGEAARGLCGQPFGAQMHGLLWGYLVARENELGLGREGGDDAQLVRLLDWWRRMMAVYRADGALLPNEAGDRQPAAPAALVAGVLAEHGRGPEALAEVGRVTAALQLYSYVLRGEQRGTTNFHGPYPAPDGRGVLIVEEFTRLRHDELPWSADPPRLPLDSVCAVFRLEGVALRFDLFQGMAAEPADYRAHATRVALLTCDDGAPRPLTAEERDALVEACRAERPRLFRASLTWDADFKIAYGAFHYLDFLMPFFDAAGCGPALADELRERVAATVRRRLREVADTDPVPVWERVYAHLERPFTPLGNVPEAAAHG